MTARLCRDCRHRSYDTQCAHPRHGQTQDLVSGRINYRTTSCYTERNYSFSILSWLAGARFCGASGKFFEQTELETKTPPERDCPPKTAPLC